VSGGHASVSEWRQEPWLRGVSTTSTSDHPATEARIRAFCFAARGVRSPGRVPFRGTHDRAAWARPFPIDFPLHLQHASGSDALRRTAVSKQTSSHGEGEKSPSLRESRYGCSEQPPTDAAGSSHPDKRSQPGHHLVQAPLSRAFLSEAK